MPDLNFKVEGAEAVLFAASPILALKLRVDSTDPEEHIHTITLRCQIQIEVARRTYNTAEQERLLDLFGQPERWSQTLRSMLWNNVIVVVPPFKGTTLVDLQVPCTFDFNVAAAKYFAGLENGEVPLCLLFSGSIFYEGHEGQLQVMQIPWDRETTYRLPVRVWQEMIEIYYPNTAWLCLRRDVFDRLNLYKMQQSIPTWEQALESILPRSAVPVQAEELLLEQPAPTRVPGSTASNHDEIELAADTLS
jgi:hypothetical protein